MYDKELISLAFAARKLKPWECFDNGGLFAVRYKKKIYICTVVGSIGEQPMIILNRSLNTLGIWKQSKEKETEFYDYRKMEEVYSNDALCCRYTCKADLDIETRMILDTYCKEEKHSVRGVDAWPTFHSMVPYRTPELLQERDDDLLKTMFKGLIDILAEGRVKANHLLCWNEGKIEKIQMPGIPKPVYAKLKPLDEFTERRLKKQKKDGTWIAKLVMLTAPIDDEEGAYFPFCLALADGVSSEMIKPIINQTAEELPVAETLLNGNCPDEVCVYDERTYELINDWMQKIGIAVEYIDEPEGMEECISMMMEQFSMTPEDLEDMMLENLDDPEFLKMIPDDMLLELASDIGSTVAPKLESEIKRRGLEIT